MSTNGSKGVHEYGLEHLEDALIFTTTSKDGRMSVMATAEQAKHTSLSSSFNVPYFYHVR